MWWSSKLNFPRRHTGPWKRCWRAEVIMTLAQAGLGDIGRKPDCSGLRSEGVVRLALLIQLCNRDSPPTSSGLTCGRNACTHTCHMHAGGWRRWRGRTEAGAGIRSAQPETEQRAVWAVSGPRVPTSTLACVVGMEGAPSGAGMLLFGDAVRKREGRERENG